MTMLRAAFAKTVVREWVSPCHEAAVHKQVGRQIRVAGKGFQSGVAIFFKVSVWDRDFFAAKSCSI